MKSKELREDLRKRITDFHRSRISLGATYKLQIPSLSVQTTACKYKLLGIIASLPRSLNQRGNWLDWLKLLVSVTEIKSHFKNAAKTKSG